MNLMTEKTFKYVFPYILLILVNIATHFLSYVECHFNIFISDSIENVEKNYKVILIIDWM